MSEKKQFATHLLRSILIAFGSSAVYLIVAPVLITGMYAELFHFFAAIGLFSASVVFYFIFMFFRSIHKLRWLFGGIAVLGAVIAFANSNVDIAVLNFLNSSKLPQKYVEYQDLEQGVIEFKHQKMKLVIDGTTDLQHYLTAKNQLIVVQEIDELKEGESIKHKMYSKFDRLGNLVNQFKTSIVEEVLFEGYLINRDNNYYRTWPLDGDTTKIKIAVHNEDFNLDENKQADFVVALEQNATLLLLKDCWTTDQPFKKFTKTIYWENGQWMAFYSDADINRSIKSRGKVYNDLFRYYSTDDYKLVAYENSNIQYQYFQKIKLNRSNSGSENWVGFLYTDVLVGSDTLKIKQGINLGANWKIDHFKIKDSAVSDTSRNADEAYSPYYLYSNPAIQFQLFTNHLGQLYFITTK